MNFRILQNDNKTNHIKKMAELAGKSDTLIIVSPFLTEKIDHLFEHMKTIKKVTVYTTLDKFNDTAQKAISLYEFFIFCKKNDIDLIIKVDEELHGKVYLFYMGIEPEGFIVTSGNFTDKGLIRSHEFGVMIEDAEQQKNMADMLMAISTYDLDEKSLNRLYNEAVTFIDKHTRIKVEEFKAKKIIDKKPSESQKTNQHFYIKPIGTSKNPFIEPMVLNDNDTTGFNKNPKSMNKGDILICHSVGTSNIIGYYEVSDDEAVYIKNDDEDR